MGGRMGGRTDRRTDGRRAFIVPSAFDGTTATFIRMHPSAAEFRLHTGTVADVTAAAADFPFSLFPSLPPDRPTSLSFPLPFCRPTRTAAKQWRVGIVDGTCTGVGMYVSAAGYTTVP